MADVTVTQFAEVLKVPVDKLLSQLAEAGIPVEGPSSLISDDAKMELLSFLRRAHGKGDEAPRAPSKITLKRKVQSMLSTVVWERLQIVPARFSNEAGIIGTAALAADVVLSQATFTSRASSGRGSHGSRLRASARRRLRADV